MSGELTMTQRLIRDMRNLAAWAESWKRRLERLEHEGVPMGKAADAITELEATCTSQQATIASQAATIAGLQASQQDSADAAAIAGVPGFISGLTAAPPPPASTLAGGSGADTTVARTGAVTVAASAGN
jgi:hypothetical protein